MYVFGQHDSCTVVAYMNPGTHDATISAPVPLLALYAYATRVALCLLERNSFSSILRGLLG